MSGVASILCLLIVGVLCSVGVFGRIYRDGLLERIGMSLLAVWCFARIVNKIDDPYTEPVHLLLHFGLATFSVGLARSKANLWKRRRRADAANSSDPASRTILF